MLRIDTIVLGVGDIRRAVDFWSQALGYEPRRELGAEDDFMILDPISGHGAALALDTSESPVQDRPRVHLDPYVDSAAEQAAEIDRLVSLGAERVDWPLYPDSPDFVVLADTEANLFCIVDTSHG